MASCVITVTLNSISHFGDNIGNDWSYRVKVKNHIFSIPEKSNRGKPGINYLKYPHTWTIPGRCDKPQWVRIEASAREHDLFFDDVGRETRNVLVECPRLPGIGGGIDYSVVVPVTELFSGDHKVTFKFRITAKCEG
jgi:hypothetical protein